ncbi:MAG: hypothetical protein JWN44_2055 [Myxococcales bacterium]|nr:hypothetical protein [Myxococcales bacterium]
MTRDQLLRVSRHFRTLEEVMRWSFTSGCALVEVVTQDEYTHDVVLSMPAGEGYLVFDTT